MSIDDEFNRNCDKNYNIQPTIYPPKERIIAIGDIHGDMNLAINFLKKGKVIKEICNQYFDNKYIKEHKYMLNIQTNGLEHIITDNIMEFDQSINQANIVYRYYEVFNSSSSTELDDYYIKVIQEDNNPNNINTSEDSLKKCELIDKFRWFKWIGLSTHVVQVGDQIDRCRPFGENTCEMTKTTLKDEDSDLEIMLLYDSLDKIAQYKNGRVISLLGNHEIMNVVGDMRYVSNKGGLDFSPEPKDYEKGINIRKNVFASTIALKMSCTRSTVVVIGEYLFVHGGIANKLAYKYKLLDINQIIRKFLNKTAKHNKDLNDLLHSSKYSPLWHRKLAYIPPDINKQQHHNCKTLYEPTIENINKFNPELTMQLNGIIVGHTPQFIAFNKGITTACNDRIIRVDIGASKAFDVFQPNIVDSFSTFNSSRLPQVAEIMNGKIKILI
jgi:hypothetical protein